MLPAVDSFDLTAIPSISGTLSTPGSPTGVVCLALEQTIDASFRFGIVPSNDDVDNSAMTARLSFLIDALQGASDSLSADLVAQLPIELRPFAESLRTIITAVLPRLAAFVPDPDLTGNHNLDAVGLILNNYGNFDGLAEADTFLAAAKQDPNCSLDQ